MEDPEDPRTWTWNTPEHIDWPAWTEYPPPDGIHYDHELAANEPSPPDTKE